MNNNRRKIIQGIRDSIIDLQTELEEVQSEEQDAYDNLPESLQESEKGQVMYDALDNIESAISSLNEAMEYLDNSIQ